MSQPEPPKPPPVGYPVAIIVVALLAAITVVAIFAENQTTLIMLFGSTILAAAGLGAVRASEGKAETRAVKEQTNGNQTLMMGMFERMARMLAVSHPLSPEQMAAAMAEPAEPVAPPSANPSPPPGSTN